MQDLIAEFAGHQTPTGDLVGLAAFATVLSERYRAMGGQVRRIARAGGDVVVVDFEGRGDRRDQSPALLLGHYDTVHPRDAIPVVLGEKILRGPGVYDMKGGLVVAETALAVLQELDMAQRPVRIVLTPDEEIGSPSSREVVIAEAAGTSHVLGLEPPHPDGSLKSSRHGSTRVRISVQGRSSHAALAPDKGVNAIDELCDQLRSVRGILDDFPEVLVNIGTITGGGLTNVVPASAHADVGLRFPTIEDETQVLGRLESLSPLRSDAAVEVTILGNRTPWSSSHRSEQLLNEVVQAAAVTGVHITAAPSAGSADTNLTGALGIPTLDGFGPLGSGAHAATERIQLDSLPDRVCLLAMVLHLV